MKPREARTMKRKEAKEDHGKRSQFHPSGQAPAFP
jgi:hypothetical protein